MNRQKGSKGGLKSAQRQLWGEEMRFPTENGYEGDVKGDGNVSYLVQMVLTWV